jgi:hypothetical protein
MMASFFWPLPLGCSHHVAGKIAADSARDCIHRLLLSGTFRPLLRWQTLPAGQRS